MTAFFKFLPALLLMTSVACAQKTKRSDKDLNATLWVQTSGEFQALALQAYNIAKMRLDQALADPTWTAALEQSKPYDKLEPAIILDIDETVLDNSPFQGRLVEDNLPYTRELWDAWVKQAAAKPIPGALDFIRYAQSKGVTVLYITNRECFDEGGKKDCSQKTATISNLARLGFPHIEPNHMLIKKEEANYTSDKTSRRALFANDYRILLLVGDDLGDFMGGVKGDGVTVKSRKELVRKHRDKFGKQWIVLPNPAYGSWQNPVREDPWKHLKSFK